MSNKYFICSSLAALAALLMIGCTKLDQENAPQFSQAAMKGKAIFEARNCGSCHAVNGTEVAKTAPNLSSPFIANDSMFVRAHLEFVEKSEMPPIDLSQEDMRLLSLYIAEIHRANHPSVPEEQADTYCPVCYAPVSMAQASADKLVSSYLGDKYYFECEDCMKAFEEAPEAFLVLWRDYLEQKKVSVPTGTN